MKLLKIILLGVTSILLLAVIFGSLIIWGTPVLYNRHPIIQNDDVKDSLTATPHAAIFYNDTIFLNSDTIIIHHSMTKSEMSETTASDSPSMGDLGTFGDSAGFWNAIFSALAMVCVIVTLVYQSNKDRQEDERARLAQFQEQCLTMLSMLSDIVAQLRVSERTGDSFFSDVSLGIWDNNSNSPEPYVQTTPQNNRPEIKGRACFKYIYDERPENRNIKAFITLRQGRIDEDLFISLRSVMETQFDHYFRIVYRTLKFIKEQDLGNIPEKKQRATRELCADLLRAQLSTYELAVLYYNGLFPKFRNTSKPIYEHFCIFDNLDPKFLITESEREYYKQVRTQHKDLEEFDNKIHYRYYAFVAIDSKPSQKNIYWHKLGINKLKRICNNILSRKANQQNIPNEHSEKFKHVYNTLNELAGTSITNKSLASKCHCTVNVLKEILQKLEDDGYIEIKNTRQGKKYTILKDL